MKDIENVKTPEEGKKDAASSGSKDAPSTDSSSNRASGAKKAAESKPPQSGGKSRGDQGRGDQKPKDGGGPAPNSLREFRIEAMMSKAELARKAGLSVLTISRIEKGYGCRMDTKRKILKALGLKPADRRKVFRDE